MEKLSSAQLPEVHRVSKEEGQKIFDNAARKFMGMSGPEFLAAWDVGKFDDMGETRKLMRVARLLPFGRG